MDLSRAVYSRDLKIAAMRALDAGSADRRNCAEISTEPETAGALAGRVARAEGNWRFPASAGAAPICRRWTTPAASPSWSARSASSRWRMIF